MRGLLLLSARRYGLHDHKSLFNTANKTNAYEDEKNLFIDWSIFTCYDLQFLLERRLVK